MDFSDHYILFMAYESSYVYFIVNHYYRFIEMYTNRLIKTKLKDLKIRYYL